MTREELLQRAKDELLNSKLTHITLGEATIVEVLNIQEDEFDYKHDIAVRVVFTDTKEEKAFGLRVLLERGLATIEKEDFFINEFSNEFTRIVIAEDNEAIKARQEAKLQAEKECAEKKFTKHIEAALKTLNNLEKDNIKLKYNDLNNFYTALGWMTKHCGTVRAAMPDFAEKWFVSKFGDVKRYVVDQKKRTVGGFSMQWALGMKITFKKVKEVPAYIASKLNEKNAINSVGFVWDLVDTYGFQFGTEQDVEKIRDNVPTSELDAFDLGYSL